MREICGAERGEVTGHWRKQPTGGASPDIILVIKSR